MNVDVKMIRPSLDDIPEAALPSGITVRYFEPNDERTWLDVYTKAEQFLKLTPETFAKQFHGDLAALAKRMFFFENEDLTPIATSTAWYDDDGNRPECGRVHWVAIIPEFQGKGLAKPLLTETLNRLSRLGHTKAYLMTSTGRVPAISLYLKYGFLPEPRSEEEKQAWRELIPQLKPAYAETVDATIVHP